MFRINSSLPSLLAMNLSRANALTAQALERLSTGLRINRAADDASGLTTSERLRSLIGTLEQSNRNAETAITFSQTAESGLGTIEDAIQELKALAIQAADTSISSTTRSAIQEEADALLNEIDRIANSTTFNGTSLLASASQVTFFVGNGGGGVNDVIGLSLPASTTSDILAGVTSASIATSNNSTAITSIETAIDTVSLNRTKIGAVQNRLESAMNDIGSKLISLQEANSVIRDTDFAVESSNLLRAQILAQTNVFGLTHFNLLSQNVLALFGVGQRT